MYRFNRSLYLTTTRVELIRVLSHHLAAKLFPWPEDLPRRNRHDGEDTLDWCQRAHHTPYSTPSRGGPLHRHGTYTWRDPGAAMAAPRTTGIAWQLRSFVSVLRSVALQTTGDLRSGQVRSEWIQGANGPVPHASPSLFCDYLNWWLMKARPSNCLPLLQLLLSTSRTCSDKSRPNPAEYDSRLERTFVAC
ncbi:hypothetical protein BKA82DRAFT_2633172 [Pisolithus tinctorius]|nr:hypothetical protein BKA82DRAFT_2633172 [Pisolithus tinctorius]